MKYVINQYNLALEYIQLERYEEAITLLKEIIIHHPEDRQLNWTLGLVELALGQLYQALASFQKAKPEKSSREQEMIARVQSLLPRYGELVNRYQEALEHIQQENFSQASNILTQLMADRKELPLPSDVYYAHLLLLLLKGDVAKAKQAWEKAPACIQQTAKMQSVRAKYFAEQSPEDGSKVGSSSIRGFSSFKWGLVACLAVGLLLAGGLLGSYLSNMNETEQVNMVSTEPSQPLELMEEQVNKLKALEIENAQLAQHVEQMMHENSEAAAVLAQKTEEMDEFLALVDAANVSMDELTYTAALNSYRAGLSHYRQGEYELALDFFTRSKGLGVTAYFSDDNDYFLIHAKRKLGQTVGLADLYHQFLEEYAESTYLDYVLQEKATLEEQQ